MRQIHITNQTHPIDHPIRVAYCDSFWGRFCGLMLRKCIPSDQGLLLVEETDTKVNSAIHMLFMNFDITAVWINSQMQVVDVKRAKKWKLAYIPAAPARYVLETHTDRLLDYHIGDKITFNDI
jgi:uncharacterized membrane protein (UPF0127 family)